MLTSSSPRPSEEAATDLTKASAEYLLISLDLKNLFYVKSDVPHIIWGRERVNERAELEIASDGLNAFLALA